MFVAISRLYHIAIDLLDLVLHLQSGSGTASSKGFVFTSSSNDKTEDANDENVAVNHKVKSALRPEQATRKSWSVAATKRRMAPSDAVNKKRKSGDLFSVLSSYQCVSSTRHES